MQQEILQDVTLLLMFIVCAVLIISVRTKQGRQDFGMMNEQQETNFSQQKLSEHGRD